MYDNLGGSHSEPKESGCKGLRGSNIQTPAPPPKQPKISNKSVSQHKRANSGCPLLKSTTPAGPHPAVIAAKYSERSGIRQENNINNANPRLSRNTGEEPLNSKQHIVVLQLLIA